MLLTVKDNQFIVDKRLIIMWIHYLNIKEFVGFPSRVLLITGWITSNHQKASDLHNWELLAPNMELYYLKYYGRRIWEKLLKHFESKNYLLFFFLDKKHKKIVKGCGRNANKRRGKMGLYKKLLGPQTEILIIFFTFPFICYYSDMGTLKFGKISLFLRLYWFGMIPKHVWEICSLKCRLRD